ncbi:MAG: endo-1,4-beta-xylanase [Chitinophagaceae bacterium]|nr:endo-1,4-beta-xylanase [Chitinophagaceae bacterium]
MHVTRFTTNVGIDNMFKKLAATGLKIHVSEFDVRMNPNSVTYSITAMEENYQAQMYNYIVGFLPQKCS